MISANACLGWTTCSHFAAVFSLGVLGYAAFWLAFVSYPVFAKLKIVLLAVLLIYFGVLAYRGRLRDYRWLVEPLLFTFLFYLAVMSLGFSAGGLDQPVLTARGRFSPLLPEDNILPYIVAIGLHDGRIPSPLVGDWLASDRPPLQTGLYLLLTLHNRILPYQVVAALLQATYLFGVWGIAAAANLPKGPRRITLLASCFLPTALINTFFTWPKMLAVGYLLLLFALLFCRRSENDAERRIIGILSGGLAALAMLSHGSSAFVLIGLALAVLAFWAWPPLKTVAYGLATLIALYLPWVLFQNFIDPPGNRLLKWHLAGVQDLDHRTFFAALRDSYGALSWQEYLQGRVANAFTLIDSWPRNLTDIASIVVQQDAASAVSARSRDFFLLLPSLHFYSIALICAVTLLSLKSIKQVQQQQTATRLLATIVATCAGFAILIFIPGQTINHVGSYATQVMITIFVFIVLSMRAMPLAIAFILLQGASVATLYATTLPQVPGYWPCSFCVWRRRLVSSLTPSIHTCCRTSRPRELVYCRLD